MNTTTVTMTMIAILAVSVAGCGDSLGSIGISPATPLGEFAEIDGYLASKGKFTRTERTFKIPEAFNNTDIFEKVEELKVYQYQEYAQQSEGKHVVLVGVDAGGQVQAIGGQFYSGSAKWNTTGTRTQAFLAEFWADVAGVEPTFAKDNRPGIDVDEFLHTSLNNVTVRGRWEKIPSSGDASHTRSIWDMILIWRKR